MTFETIFISTLLLTHLAKPAQLLQSFGLNPVGYLQVPAEYVCNGGHTRILVDC